MNDLTTITTDSNAMDVVDQRLAAEESRHFMPGREGIAFSSADYVNDDEAFAALEAFLMGELEVSDDDE
jgi:hypothetical protein